MIEESNQFINNATAEDIHKAIEFWNGFTLMHDKKDCNGSYELQSNKIAISDENGDHFHDKDKIFKCNRCDREYPYIFFMLTYYYHTIYGDL